MVRSNTVTAETVKTWDVLGTQAVESLLILFVRQFGYALVLDKFITALSYLRRDDHNADNHRRIDAMQRDLRRVELAMEKREGR
ncbi:MAG TPA: hypothetical protein VH439_03925 [Gemmatimonadales bacterium]|jgi:hypothetical protein